MNSYHLSKLEPENYFAGFPWPRYVATLPRGPLPERARARRRIVCGAYITHGGQPGGTAFYLDGSTGPDIRWQYADDVHGAGIRHHGWYTDEHGDGDTIRGLVVRLSRGRGFLAGWTMGPGMISSLDTDAVYDDEIDAARVADSAAENAAERERLAELQYQEDIQ